MTRNVKQGPERFNPLTDIEYPTWIPIFPLAHVVLLPKALLPLHVFEPRYRAMTREALQGPGLVAMALLKPGFELLYDTLEADIHCVVCVGSILQAEELPDGRYNFWLQGLQRARIIEENKEHVYRRAMLRPLLDAPSDPSIEGDLRFRLNEALTRPALWKLAADSHWLELLTCTAIGFSDLVDALAAAVLESTADKQAFLAQPCLQVRVEMLLVALDAVGDALADCCPDRLSYRSEPPACWEN